jgi:hypothetical protein
MNVRQSVLGEVAVRSGQHLSSVDVGALIRRLILFDRVIVKSFRLREVPVLVRVFGKAGFSQLLESGLLQFSCEFTSLIIDISRGGVRHVPLNHFSFGTADAADRDGTLKAELRCLQSISGLKNPERASLEEVIWKSVVRPPTTYAKDLLQQIDHDLRTNTPALKAAVIEQLRAVQTPDLTVADIPIEVEETSNRIFHVKNTLAETFEFSPENAHLVLQKAISAVANLDHRLADMQAYSAITGFLDSESPLLFGKLAGIIAPLNPKLVEKQFERVVELASIPDFKSGQSIDVEKLIQVRESVECREFRAWLTTLDVATDAEITGMVASIKSKMASLANSISGKLVRLAATTGIGLIPVVGPIAGAVAGVVDSFLVEKVLPQSGVVAFLTETYPSLFISA